MLEYYFIMNKVISMNSTISNNENNISSDYNLIQKCLANSLKKNVYRSYNPICEKCREKKVVRPATKTKIIRNSGNIFDDYISLCDDCYTSKN